MEAKTFTFYNTERHGYVETTRAYLRKLKISKLISPYSRQSGNKVYIEEDGDLSLFCKRHTVAGISIILKEAEKEQRFFDNMWNYRDDECQDEQFDGFKSEWSLSQRVHFSKPDNIKHLRNSTFETKDKKCLKIVPTFYLDGKILNEAGLKKLGIELTTITCGELDYEYEL
jgi:hypothetical protein